MSKGASPVGDRAVAASPSSPSVSPVPASIPSAATAQRRRAQGTYKRRQRDSIVKRDGKQCHYCGVETVKPRFSGDNTDRVRTVDHVVPLSAGGSNRLDNLVIACGWCNNAKADGHLDAQAIEARRAETAQQAPSQDESAVGSADAPAPLTPSNPEIPNG